MENDVFDIREWFIWLKQMIGDSHASQITPSCFVTWLEN